MDIHSFYDFLYGNRERFKIEECWVLERNNRENIIGALVSVAGKVWEIEETCISDFCATMERIGSVFPYV